MHALSAGFLMRVGNSYQFLFKIAFYIAVLIQN